MTFTLTLILLLAGHAICDYPLQGEFLSHGKNHKQPIPGIPFWQCLFAHAMIHAGMVALVTHRPVLALAEFVIHAATDYGKREGWFGFNTDQTIHVACKIVWAAWAVLC